MAQKCVKDYRDIVVKGKKDHNSREWKMLQLATNHKDEMDGEFKALYQRDLRAFKNKQQKETAEKLRSSQQQKHHSTQAQLQNDALQKIMGNKTATNNIEVQQVSPEQDAAKKTQQNNLKHPPSTNNNNKCSTETAAQTIHEGRDRKAAFIIPLVNNHGPLRMILI